MEIELPPIDVQKVRKLKAHWSIEAQQDLLATHNLNSYSILVDKIVDEINNEGKEEVKIPTKKKKYRSIDDPWELE